MASSTESIGRADRLERRAMLRVLIVDDMPEIRFLLEIALSREARVALVGQAEDGRQAIEKTELLRPELVVMDIQMPQMSGVEATKHITERWPRVEVVGFTSSGPEDGHLELVAAGAVSSYDKHELKGLLAFIRERSRAYVGARAISDDQPASQPASRSASSS